jgi:hypothetical protein
MGQGRAAYIDGQLITRSTKGANMKYTVQIGNPHIGTRLYGVFDASEQAQAWGEANANLIWQELATIAAKAGQERLERYKREGKTRYVQTNFTRETKRKDFTIRPIR